MARKKLYVIDGHALIYRAYYAFISRPLVNAKGENTSAIFGFTRMLVKLMKTFNPDHLLVTFDSSGKTFRHEMFEEYKAQRKKMPDDLRAQIPEIKNIVQALGIRQMEVQGFEADDIIGTMAVKAETEGYDIFIISRDKDLSQLLTDHVSMLLPNIGAAKKGEEEFTLITKENSAEQFEVIPEKIIDYLALAGDASDNIPGVRGIGPKTAMSLLEQFGTVKGLYDRIHEVKSESVRKKLIECQEEAFKSYELATIRKDVPLTFTWEEMTPRTPNREVLTEIFERHSVKALFKDLEFVETASERGTYTVITKQEDFDAFLVELEKQECFAMDSETTGFQFPVEKIQGLSFSWKEGEGYYIALTFDGDSIFKREGIDSAYAFSKLKTIYENPAIKKVGQNIKFDVIFLQQEGIHTKGIHFDTMVASFLIDPATPHNLDDLAEIYLGYTKIKLEDLMGKGKKKLTMSDIPVDKLGTYSCEDADITFRLYKLFEPKLKEMKLDSLLHAIDIPLISVLAEMEQNGVKIDETYLKKLSSTFQKRLDEIEILIHKEAGGEFNIASTKQLQEILFNKMNLPPVKKTKTGQSTDNEVLEELSPQYPIAKFLLEYRTLSKLKNTYSDALPELINPVTKRIHTSFNQTIAATGRLTSTNPNLQNIPSKEDIGRQIRNAFIADKGHVLISSDYSQIELRILAHITEDPVLINAFKNNEDIHSRTAREIYNLGKDDEVTKEQRATAKVINFGVVYGMGPYNLSQQLGIPVDQAKEYIDAYFARYKGITRYFEQIRNDIAEKHFVENLFGRRRYFADITNMQKRDQESVFRMAINTPIQGTAADLIKVAMINISEEMKKQGLKSRMILQIHDELVFEVPQDEKELMLKFVKEKMETARQFLVPIVAEIKAANNWSEAH